MHDSAALIDSFFSDRFGIGLRLLIVYGRTNEGLWQQQPIAEHQAQACCFSLPSWPLPLP